MNKKGFGWVIFLALCISAQAQQKDGETNIAVEGSEKWFGATVVDGKLMPFQPGFSFDMHGDVKGNQATPLLLSTAGRYVWSNSAFAFKVSEGNITISRGDSVIVYKAGKTLAEAYRDASKRFFPATGKMPDPLLFQQPQYNTWIELVYNQNQADILKYAHAIINNGFPPGVLMIDDNWAPYYGKFEFRKDRFSDPKKMIDELHALGFKVMIWVCPFVSPDSEVFRALKSRKLFLMAANQQTWEKATEPALINWWNGYSAVMDLTNPDAVQWFNDQLKHMVSQYGIDGFKLDAGDPEFYPPGSISFKPATGNDQTELWGTFGLEFPLNEYRAMWKRGGQPLAQRLRDKTNTWEDLQKLVPDITNSGLLGYAFACPDMIGGGEYSSFIGKEKLDQELIVRSAQSHALMPMMQFSVAPWRVLDSLHLHAVKSAVGIRAKFVPLIMRLAKEAAATGEPIVRKMEYDFPNQGFATVNDQFMLGDSVLVAPMNQQGTSRKVRLPKGNWISDEGTKLKGPVELNVTVPLERLPWFRLTKRAK